MIISKDCCILDVDLTETRAYYENNSLCQYSEDRNFYIQARNRFPKLTAWLEELGIPIDRPDEIGSIPLENTIDYLFVAYSVVGKLTEPGEYIIELLDGNAKLKIIISNQYFPNDQKTDNYFTVSVCNIQLPWVLEEPFPKPKKSHASFLSRIIKFFQF